MSRPSLDRLTLDRRLVGLLFVLALLVGALVVGTRGSDPSSSAAAALSPALQQARAEAALPPCPVGLGVDLPGLSLPCMADGPDVPVATAPGRPMLVNVWGTWCPPCVAEVPELVQFAAAAGDRVGVVGVATEDTPDSVYAFAKAYGVNYPQVRDDLGQVLRHFASYGTGVPKTVLVTATGEIAYVQVGQFHSLAEVQAAVATHLGVQL